MQQRERKCIFSPRSWDFLGKRYRHGIIALPCGCHTNRVGQLLDKRGLHRPGASRGASSAKQLSLLLGPWAPFALVGFKFMEFYWQVGTSCLQTLSSLISVPWCYGQQLKLAEIHQKHSSSLRKCAEFMLNLIMLFFPHCEFCNFCDLGALSFYAFSFGWLNQGILLFNQEKNYKKNHIILFYSSIVLKVTSA